jgi:hypothetical protein
VIDLTQSPRSEDDDVEIIKNIINNEISKYSMRPQIHKFMKNHRLLKKQNLMRLLKSQPAVSNLIVDRPLVMEKIITVRILLSQNLLQVQNPSKRRYQLPRYKNSKKTKNFMMELIGA